MAFKLENYGLNFLTDDDEFFKRFLGYLTETGIPILGYYGAPYFFKSTGTSEFWLNTERNEQGTLNVTGIDVHSGGPVIWDLIHTGIDVTPESSSKLERTIMFSRKDGKFNLLPVNVINADVLPSFLEGDSFRLQVVAQPLNINYYATEEEYLAAQPDSSNGKKIIPAEGTLIASGFLYNHSTDNNEHGKNHESDGYVLFHARVKHLYHGTFQADHVEENRYIRCFAETSYGELEFDHTYEQVPEELRKNIKPGAVISGVCIISGDAAIGKYENGAIKDFDHDLRLLRYSMNKGETERLRSVLSETANYSSEVSRKVCIGQNEIIERLGFVHENADGKYQAHLATITESCNPEYPDGTRCIALEIKKENRFQSVVFISVNEDGKIQNILTSNDCSYRFRIDEPETIPAPLDEIKIPNNVYEMIILRAKYHGLFDWEIEPEAITSSISDYKLFQDNAQKMLVALQENPQQDVEKVFENIFGYLFAKAIEQEVNTKNTRGDTLPSYYPLNAFNGKIESNLSEENHTKLEEAMDLGKQFYKDFKNYITIKEISDDDFLKVFTEAAIVVQRIGQLGVHYFFHE